MAKVNAFCPACKSGNMKVTHFAVICTDCDTTWSERLLGIAMIEFYNLWNDDLMERWKPTRVKGERVRFPEVRGR